MFSKLRTKINMWLNQDYTKNEPVAYSELDDRYLFDFKNFSSSYHGGGGTFIVGGGDADMAPSAPNSKPLPKIVVKPIDVLNELETIPTPFTNALIDEKIAILKDKEKLIVQHYAKREVSGLIERLENRKKYNEHKAFFDKFQNTTDEKIDVLLKKYNLVMKASDIFIPEFPTVAIEIMKEYSEKLLAICDKKPVFYVIATNDCFEEAYKKRDPILLVQSPFGFYWQILGAWDSEMILLSEL